MSRSGELHLSAVITVQPGWKWAQDVKPVAGTDLCMAPHQQYQISGRIHVMMADGTEADGVSNERIAELVREHFDLRPGAIVRDLDLRRPIYRKTAAYGHFGRADADFTWERTDKANALRQAARSGNPRERISTA